MLWLFLSSNLSLPYKIKSIKLFSFCVEKELSIDMATQKIMCTDFGFDTTRTKRV